MDILDKDFHMVQLMNYHEILNEVMDDFDNIHINQ